MCFDRHLLSKDVRTVGATLCSLHQANNLMTCKHLESVQSCAQGVVPSVAVSSTASQSTVSRVQIQVYSKQIAELYSYQENS